MIFYLPTIPPLQEAVKRHRLQMLNADMQDLLTTGGDADEAEPADVSLTCDGSGKNDCKQKEKAGQGVSKPGPKGNSTVGGAATEKKEEVVEEEEDELTLCIVCMTEKRNACLVHGKTSHQVRDMNTRGARYGIWVRLKAVVRGLPTLISVCQVASLFPKSFC